MKSILNGTSPLKTSAAFRCLRSSIIDDLISGKFVQGNNILRKLLRNIHPAGSLSLSPVLRSSQHHVASCLSLPTLSRHPQGPLHERMRSVSASARRIEIGLLSRTAFQPFGDVIENPQTTNEGAWPVAKHANQGSALKYADISTVTNTYPQSSGVRITRPSISLFVCSPRHPVTDESAAIDYLRLSVLERHRFTTQTFVPLDHPPEASYLVVVAPSKHYQVSEHDLPDVDNMRAFIAKSSQAITYGAAVWHAPMIVLGRHPITFVVSQYVNDVPEDDCEECCIESAGLGLHVSINRAGKPNLKP